MTVIYGVCNQGIYWFNHLEEGTKNWANQGNGVSLNIAGWKIFDHTKYPEGSAWEHFIGAGDPFVNEGAYMVCCNDHGVIYGLTPAGELKWYKNLGELDGTVNWEKNPGRTVRSDWGGIAQILGGGGGVIYTKMADGTLKWWKHTGDSYGTNSWKEQSGTVVGTGWNNITAFSGRNGLIYGINSVDGGLYWYKHNGYFGAKKKGDITWVHDWANSGKGIKIGLGWDAISHPFCGPNGQIYAQGPGGLLWYKHLGYQDGSAKWLDKKGISIMEGWSWNQTLGVINPGPPKIEAPHPPK